MSVNKFSNMEIEMLKKNKYVKKVSENGITYTNEFREDFASLLNNGKTTSEIFNILGFDTKILGDKRIYSTTNRIKQMMKKNKGFDDTRTTNSGRSKIKDLTLEEEIEQLKHKNLLLQQENEFLKKMKFLVKEKSWEKSLQEKNTK